MLSLSPLYAFWLSFGIAAAVAVPILRLLAALKSRQTIDKYAPEGHQKKQGTPTMGGLIILAGWLPSLLLTQTDPSLVVAVVGFGLIGFVDDFVVPRMIAGKRGLGWKQKIVLQILFAVLACWFCEDFQGRGAWIAGGAFLLLFFANAYNFADGLDGLAAGLGVVLCSAIALLFVSSSTAGASLSLIGALLVFLFFNAPPARVFMGDVGSLPIGAFFGLTYAKFFAQGAFGVTWPWAAALAVLNFVLILELVLVPIQVGYYKLTKKRIFPATPIHHAFEVKGWPESRVVWTFVLVQIVCAFLALTILLGPMRMHVVPDPLEVIATR